MAAAMPVRPPLSERLDSQIASDAALSREQQHKDRDGGDGGDGGEVPYCAQEECERSVRGVQRSLRAYV